jgi:hypothetical protein
MAVPNGTFFAFPDIKFILFIELSKNTDASSAPGAGCISGPLESFRQKNII